MCRIFIYGYFESLGGPLWPCGSLWLCIKLFIQIHLETLCKVYHFWGIVINSQLMWLVFVPQFWLWYTKKGYHCQFQISEGRSQSQDRVWDLLWTITWCLSNYCFSFFSQFIYFFRNRIITGLISLKFRHSTKIKNKSSRLRFFLIVGIHAHSLGG